MRRVLFVLVWIAALILARLAAYVSFACHDHLLGGIMLSGTQ